MDSLHSPVAIEFISVFGMPPVDFVRLAADMEVDHVGMALEPVIPINPHGYPAWSLRDQPDLRRELKAVLADTGIGISIGEGFFVAPGADIRQYGANLDIMADLGVPIVNMLYFDPDPSRCIDQCAAFARMAGERGMASILEYLPHHVVNDLAAASWAVEQVGRPDFGVLVDAMHFFRSGSSAQDMASAPPGTVKYVQICDVPRICPWESYSYEAQFERGSPGEGELPLAAFLSAVPDGVVIGLEIPQRRRAEAGIGPHERIAPAVRALRSLLHKKGDA